LHAFLKFNENLFEDTKAAIIVEGLWKQFYPKIMLVKGLYFVFSNLLAF